MRRIRDGFTGQKMLVLPKQVVKDTASCGLTKNLYLTDIGFFPDARYHYVERSFKFPQYILIYCVSGAGWYKLSQEIEIKQNQFCILPANEYHSYGACNNDPWTIYWFHFSGENASNLWKIYYNSHYPCRQIPYSTYRIELFNKLYNTLDIGYSRQHVEFASLVLPHLISSFLYPYLFESIDKDSPRHRIDEAIVFMRANLTISLSLKQIAKQVNYSVPHFVSEFKKKTGYSPIDYHNRLRIQKACQFFDLTNKAVKEVSLMLGYKDPYYFSRLFSKIIGQSPTVYKNRIKG